MSSGVIALPALESAAVAALSPNQYRTIVSSVSQRAIAIVRCRDGLLAAVDLHCFHMGSPLGRMGHMDLVDIEDAGVGIRCPAHGRVIDARTGKLCAHADGSGACPHAVGEPQQRVHAVRQRDDGIIEVRLCDALSLPSDAYNARAPAPGPPAGSSATPTTNTIAFACRKSRAVAAVAAKRAPPPVAAMGAASTASAAAASPTSPGVRALRQMKLFEVPAPTSGTGAARATAPPPDDSSDEDAMDVS